MFEIVDSQATGPIIKVIGVGGAGGNAINHMIDQGVEGVEFIAVNTDLQSLQQSSADVTLHIGSDITRGLGSGSDPTVGRACTRSSPFTHAIVRIGSARSRGSSCSGIFS